jgi:hypothetical protein
MPRILDTGGELPWPTQYLCSDGVVRNLARYIPEQWRNASYELSWRGCRADVAHSLGRKALPEISAMTPYWAGG